MEACLASLKKDVEYQELFALFLHISCNLREFDVFPGSYVLVGKERNSAIFLPTYVLAAVQPRMEVPTEKAKNRF